VVLMAPRGRAVVVYLVGKKPLAMCWRAGGERVVLVVRGGQTERVPDRHLKRTGADYSVLSEVEHRSDPSVVEAHGLLYLVQAMPCRRPALCAVCCLLLRRTCILLPCGTGAMRVGGSYMLGSLWVRLCQLLLSGRAIGARIRAAVTE